MENNEINNNEINNNEINNNEINNTIINNEVPVEPPVILPQMPTENVQAAKVCRNCGSTLEEGQAFCPICGQPVEIQMNNPINPAIEQFNQQMIQQKPDNKKWFIIGGVVAAIILVIILFSNGNSFKEGEYVRISAEPNVSYTFENGRYEYDADEDEDDESGSYVAEKGEVVITDEDGDDKIFAVKGKYIYNTEMKFDDIIDSGSTVSQDLSYSIKSSYKGTTVELILELNLSADGSYERIINMVVGSRQSEMMNEEGTYKKTGSELILSPDEESYDLTYLINDGMVYYSVFERQ